MIRVLIVDHHPTVRAAILAVSAGRSAWPAWAKDVLQAVRLREQRPARRIEQ